MKTTNLILKSALALAIAGMLATGPAFADNDNKGNKGNKGGKGHSQQRHDGDERKTEHKGGHGKDDKRGEWRDHRFQDNHRLAARDYYDSKYRGSRCPPGLAKKNNGCVPPGHARKWQQGHSLPRNVTFHSVPKPLVLQLGQPPAGYQYVRVSSDILLMEMATRLIVDSILDLGRS